MSHKRNLKGISAAGLIVALGIIYGDIGTSPLYVMNAIIRDHVVNEFLIIGAISCVIWTLTLQTTVKYVILTLQADNNGEGGIFSLYALVRRQKKWLVYVAMIGGASLLADGIITPPVTVTSAVEGLRLIHFKNFDLATITTSEIVWIVIFILAGLFFLQQFGTASIGKFFGPVMLLWFGMLAVVGFANIHLYWPVLKAFNPYYAFKLLTMYPHGFWLLGAVFLCTTGAEALYSDMGHCGRENIRISWIFVKVCLLANYLGQGAWLLHNLNGQTIDSPAMQSVGNAFFNMMPDWFKLTGIILATLAAVIASQALISGSFTLISEAQRLNLWPKIKINYPTEEKGQVYIPGLNWLLCFGCFFIVLFFKESAKMEGAYGLAITLCMISTSILYANYLQKKRTNIFLRYLYLSVFLIIEFSFFFANLDKFPHGGYVTVIVAGILFYVMYTWFRARKIKNRYVEFVRLEHYIPMIQELSNDKTVVKYATHLVYMTSADNPKEIEHKIVYSILNRKPKRADIYWFVHVDVLDDPYTCEYVVDHIIPNDIIRVEFRLGFRVEQKISSMMKKVVGELALNREVNIVSRYESLERNNVAGDFQFIVMEKYLSNDNDLSFMDKLIMKSYFWLKQISLNEERGFGLDQSSVDVEKYPLIVTTPTSMPLKRIFPKEKY